MLRVFGSNDKEQRGGVEKVGRNFSRLVLALVIFATVFLTSGGRVATDPTTVGWVYASPDCASGEWERGGGTADLTIYSLASHPESSRVFAGTWGDGVYRAVSGANSWSPTSLMGPTEITSLSIDPTDPANVYAGTRGSGVKRSYSSGDMWGPTAGLEGQEVWSLAVTSTATSTYAYAGTAGAIYTSTNGISWDLAGGVEIGAEKFYALVIDPQDSKTAYVGTKEKGVYRTTDGGTGWTQSGLDGKTVRALVLHPEDSEIIYAGTQPHGIFKSTDGGTSWPVNGLIGRAVLAIAINPCNPEFVYAGTYGEGVWASYDGGNSWHQMPSLPDAASYVYSLTLFTPEGEDDCQVLYAGTNDGVWARVVTSFYTIYLPLVYKG
jgi:hypothetical protein